ncbi:MAG: hypothetical protein AB1467_02350 [Candidatus Diapherotrites archaeon]
MTVKNARIQLNYSGKPQELLDFLDSYFETKGIDTLRFAVEEKKGRKLIINASIRK